MKKEDNPKYLKEEKLQAYFDEERKKLSSDEFVRQVEQYLNILDSNSPSTEEISQLSGLLSRLDSEFQQWEDVSPNTVKQLREALNVLKEAEYLSKNDIFRQLFIQFLL